MVQLIGANKKNKLNIVIFEKNVGIASF